MNLYDTSEEREKANMYCFFFGLLDKAMYIIRERSSEAMVLVGVMGVIDG